MNNGSDGEWPPAASDFGQNKRKKSPRFEGILHYIFSISANITACCSSFSFDHASRSLYCDSVRDTVLSPSANSCDSVIPNAVQTFLSDGTVVPCCLDSEGEITLGNIFDEEISYILNSPRARAMVQGFECRRASEELCRRCGYAQRFV